MKERWCLYAQVFLTCTIAFCYCDAAEKSTANESIRVTDENGQELQVNVEDSVLVLVNKNFDAVIKATEYVVVDFYAPWCIHCKNLDPEYVKAAKILKKQTPPVTLAKVDATEERELAGRFNVDSYPMLYVFKKGKHTFYEGPFSTQGIVDYVMEQVDPDYKLPPEVTIPLTAENFSSIVTPAELILVEFYAPWCVHCKRVGPEFERAARRLKKKNVPLAKVDVEKEKALGEAHKITSYPTLVVFRKGRRFDYNGPRDELGIVKYMLSLADYPTKEIANLNQLKLSKVFPETVILAFVRNEESQYFKEYVATANNLRGKHIFVHSFSKDMASHFKVAYNSLVLMHPEVLQSQYEPKYYTLMKPDATQVNMEKFIEEHLLPLVGFRTEKTKWKFEKYPLVVVYYSVDFSFDHREETQVIRKQVLKAAETYKGRITFAVSNEEEYSEELKHLNLDDIGEEVSVAMYLSERERFRMKPSDNFNSALLMRFVEHVLQGKHRQHVRSQLPPKSQSGSLLVAVGSTFDQLVTRSKKDVLVLFVAQSCALCKDMEEELDKVSWRVEMHAPGALDMVKIDVTYNDYPAIYTQVTEFPVLYFVPVNDKLHPRLFTGIKKAFGVIKFLKENLSVPYEDGVKYPEFTRPPDGYHNEL
ncbi:protein disulfide-isomerase A4-like [Ornithodoros turicata]|uniref:protein disulfide-isomerase A4-like n=1 Tax=Ornithodoros turicata TaxID=34597 RepID=UPI00313A16AC